MLSIFCRYDRALYFNAHIIIQLLKGFKKVISKKGYFGNKDHYPHFIQQHSNCWGNCSDHQYSDHFDVENACDDTVLGYDA